MRGSTATASAGDRGERGLGRPLGSVVDPSVLAWLGGAFGSLVLAIAVGTPERMPVVLPMLAVTGSAGAFCWWLSRQRGDGFPYFEIGVVYVAVVWLYTVFPLVGFLVNGLRQTPFNDMRLYLYRPTPDELGLVGWYEAAHLAAFAAAYLMWRGRGTAGETRWPLPDRATVAAALAAYLVIGLYFLFLDFRFDLSARTYLEGYLVVRRLPLVFAQVANHLGGAQFVLQLVILAAMFRGYPRWRPLIVAWLAVVAGLALVRQGSRTEVVMLMAAAVMMYHHAVRRLRLWHAALGGVLGLTFFVVLGILRFLGTTSGGPPVDVNPIFGYVSEFENNLGNAYDLARLKAAGMIGDLPVAFYLADLLALVPQQLLPIEKVVPDVWYVNTFYPVYAATGGGLAFGSIAESVLGGGWIDAMARGAALGLLLAQVHRHRARSKATFWGFIFYTWATVSVYQSFRGTTFVLVGYAVYRFLPVMIGVKVLASVLRGLPRATGAWPEGRLVRGG